MSNAFSQVSAIREWESVDPEIFQTQILTGGQPVVFRGVGRDWPVVRAAQTSPAAFADYIKGFDNNRPVNVTLGLPSIGGRLFYRPDMKEFNFDEEKMPVSAALDRLIAQLGAAEPSSIFVQSAIVRDFIPGFAADNALDIVPVSVPPRVWIGSPVIVAAHFDLYYNIAVVGAGRRRFTLFPPEQLPNLYIGPMDFSPAGAPISMVSFDEPEFERYPRFTEALKHAQTAELGPGDAIFIPYAWWHHVRSLEPINMLINYWWNDSKLPLSPTHAMLHAVLAFRELPEDQRAAWRAMLDYYAFQTSGAPLEHLPPAQRGAMGPLTPERMRAFAQMLARSLAGSSN
ncbi:MAG: cupin-like domain-containing protein [Pseudomonadota bacterium]